MIDETKAATEAEVASAMVKAFREEMPQKGTRVRLRAPSPRRPAPMLDNTRETVRKEIALASTKRRADEAGGCYSECDTCEGDSGEGCLCHAGSLVDADNILSALAALGLAVVPVEPTDKMHAAAWAYFDNDMTPGREWPSVNRGVWQTMVAAAQHGGRARRARRTEGSCSMTDAPPWDGVPRDPERDGWHWLSHRGSPEVWEWGEQAGPPGLFGWDCDGVFIPAEQMVRNGRIYLGPCHAPSEVAALTSAAWQAGWAAGREAAAKAMHPILRSMLSRGEAQATIRALPVPPPPHGEVG